MRASWLFVAAFGVVGGGCSSSEPSNATSGAPPATGPTFHKDVEAILQQHCQTCHSPGHIAPFSLLTYADAKSVAGLMEKDTTAKIMPPCAMPTFYWLTCAPPTGPCIAPGSQATQPA